MTDHDCPHAVTLRNLLDACDRGRPLADITDRLRVEVGRLGPCAAQPDRDAAIDNAVEAADGEMAQGRANFAEWRHLFLAELSGQGYEIRASGEGTAPPPDEDHGVRLVHFGCDECKQVGRVVTKLGPECLHCDLPRGHAGDCVPMVWPQPGTTPRIKPVHIDTPDDERGTAPQVPAEWEGQTEPMPTDETPAHSNLYQLPFTPGTYVRVVAADGAPPEAAELDGALSILRRLAVTDEHVEWSIEMAPSDTLQWVRIDRDSRSWEYFEPLSEAEQAAWHRVVEADRG